MLGSDTAEDMKFHAHLSTTDSKILCQFRDLNTICHLEKKCAEEFLLMSECVSCSGQCGDVVM